MVDSQNCVTCEMVSLLKYWQELSGLLPNDPIKMVAKFRKNFLRIDWAYPKSLLLFLSRRHYRTNHDTLTQCWVNECHVGDGGPTFTQHWVNTCWANVGPLTTTLVQHPPNIETTPRVCGVPANTRHWDSVGLLLVHRLRRWPNIKPTLSQCLVLAGIVLALPAKIDAKYPATNCSCILLKFRSDMSHQLKNHRNVINIFVYK